MTASQIVGWFLTLAVAVLGFWGMAYISKHAGWVHGQLDILRGRAELAVTAAELDAVEADLRSLHREHCYHRILGDASREVLAFIRGRKCGIGKAKS